jgi:hypothetical protein
MSMVGVVTALAVASAATAQGPSPAPGVAPPPPEGAPPQADEPPVRSTYCSPSGDVCIAAHARQQVIYLDLRAAARYFARYRLCVTAPDGSATCRGFALRPRGRGHGSSIRWDSTFPLRGTGTYRARWSAEGRSLGRPAHLHHPLTGA